MSFIPCDKTVEVSLKFAQADGEFAENVFGVTNTSEWTHGEMVALCNAVMGWWHDGDGIGGIYRTFQPASVTMTGCSARDLSTEFGLTADGDTLPASTVGSGGGYQLQNGLTKAITARTGLAGRSFRGRTFLVGLTDNVLAAAGDDVVPTSTMANWVLMMNKLVSVVHTLSATYQLAVISRYHQPGGPGTPTVARTAGVMTPIVGYGYHDLFLDYQRRRAPGHNRHH